MTDSPASQLHVAAEMLRAVAREAERESPSPWRLDRDVVRCDNDGIVADASGEPDRAGDLPFIAAMHPVVGAALADLLERQARKAADVEQYLGAEFQDGALDQDIHDALAVARQLLRITP